MEPQNEQPGEPRKVDPLKRKITKTILLAVVSIFLGGLVWFYYTLAPTNASFESKVIRIKRGFTLKRTASLLAEENLIRNRYTFIYWASGRKVKAGEYRLTPGMDASAIMKILERGKSILYRITVPEGMRGKQIAELAAEKGLANKENFMKAFGDPKLLSRLGITGETAEGYLFPETYFFPKGMAAEKMIAEMVGQFEKNFSGKLKDKATDLGWSIHQAVTLASIIEKETAKPRERSLISSVFHNRLKINEKLYSDPTVMYALSRFRKLTRKDLETDSPYNTYRYKGLPPGPIASPGLESIKAALFPAETDYKFFVSKNDGTHLFSRDIKEHNRAVYKYQRKNQKGEKHDVKSGTSQGKPAGINSKTIRKGRVSN